MTFHYETAKSSKQRVFSFTIQKECQHYFTTLHFTTLTLLFPYFVYVSSEVVMKTGHFSSGKTRMRKKMDTLVVFLNRNMQIPKHTYM